MTYEKADFASPALSYTALRQEAVDFLEPIYMDLVTVYISDKFSKGNNINYTVYFDAFSNNAWIACGVLFGVIALAFLFYSPKEIRKLGIFKAMFEAVTSVGVIFILHDSADFDRGRASKKLIYLTACASGMLMYFEYTAVFTSTMISRPSLVRLDTFEDLKQKDYKLHLLAKSSVHDSFALAPKGSLFHR